MMFDLHIKTEPGAGHSILSRSTLCKFKANAMKQVQKFSSYSNTAGLTFHWEVGLRVKGGFLEKNGPVNH